MCPAACSLLRGSFRGDGTRGRRESIEENWASYGPTGGAGRKSKSDHPLPVAVADKCLLVALALSLFDLVLEPPSQYNGWQGGHNNSRIIA